MNLNLKTTIFIIGAALGLVFWAQTAQAATCESITPSSFTVTGNGGATYTAHINGWAGYVAVNIDYDNGVFYDSGYANAQEQSWLDWDYYVNPQAYGTFIVSFWPNGQKCGLTAKFIRVQPPPPPKATIEVKSNKQSAGWEISRGYSDCSQAVFYSGRGNQTNKNVEPDTYYFCPENVKDYTYTTSASPGNQFVPSGGTLTFTIDYKAKPTPTPPPPPPSCQSIDPSYYEVAGPGGKTYTARGVQGASYVIAQIHYAAQPGVPGDLYETGYAADKGGGNWSYYVDPGPTYTFVVSFLPNWVKCDGYATFWRKPAPPPPPGTIKISTNNKDPGYQFNRGKCEDGWSDRGNKTYKDMPPDYYVLCADPVSGYTVNVTASPGTAVLKSNETLTFNITYSAIPGSILVTGCFWPNTITFKLKGPSCSGAGCSGSLGPATSCLEYFNDLQPGVYTIDNVSNPNPNRYDTVVQPTSIDLKPGGFGQNNRFFISFPEKGLSASISCDPASIPFGSSAKYTWTSTGAESCAIDIHPPSQPRPPGAALPTTSGSKSSGPLFTTQDFTLTCYGYAE